MQRRLTMIAVILGVALVAGCETCVLPGCECSQEPCIVYPACECAADGTESRGTETRSSLDYVADLKSGDRATRDHAVDVLARMGPERLAEVGALFDDPDPAVRFTAMQVFVRLRQHAWTSVWYVKNRLCDPDPAIRADAAYVIGMAGECAAAEAVPQLTCALTDTSPYVRYQAAVAFQKMYAHGEPALPALEHAARCDRDPRVREAAKCAIARINQALCSQLR